MAPDVDLAVEILGDRELPGAHRVLGDRGAAFLALLRLVASEKKKEKKKKEG